VVLDHDVFDIIALVHNAPLDAGKNKTYATITEKYHGINQNKVCVSIYCVILC